MDYLDFASMKRHSFIEEDAASNVYRYNMIFSQATHEIITMAAPPLFDPQAKGRYFIMPADFTNYNNALAVAHDEDIYPWEAQIPQAEQHKQYFPGPTRFDPWQ